MQAVRLSQLIFVELNEALAYKGFLGRRGVLYYHYRNKALCAVPVKVCECVRKTAKITEEKVLPPYK